LTKLKALRDLNILIHGTPRPDIAQISSPCEARPSWTAGGKISHAAGASRSALQSACLHCYSDSGAGGFERLDIDLLRGVVADAARSVPGRSRYPAEKPLLNPSWENCFVLARRRMATTVTTNACCSIDASWTSWGLIDD